MATPLPAATFLAVLRAEGVTVHEYRSWRTHERDDETGRQFGPVHGVVIHHTAGRDSLALCYNGTADLPGPLCHTHLSKSGTATMVSAGRANHAGSFAANAHQAVLDEASVHPRPDAAEPIDANDCYYGIEIENLGNGTDPYPDVQYEAAVRWAAAICRAHGWTANSVIGHKEGTRRKIDPSFDMNAFRKAVDERLAHTPDWNPDEEDNVALTADDISKVANKVVDLLTGTRRKELVAAIFQTDNVVPSDQETNPYWYVETFLREGRKADDEIRAKLDGLAVGGIDLDALAAKVAPLLATELAERLAE